MQIQTPHTVSQRAGVLLGNFNNALSSGSTRELGLEVPKEAGQLKSVYDMRLSHSGLNTRPISQSKSRQRRKHLQSAVTRTMAPKLTALEETEPSYHKMQPIVPSIQTK